MGQPNELGIQAALRRVPVDTLIAQALEKNSGNIAAAASDLGVSRQALAKRLAKRQRSYEQATAGK